MTLSGLRSLRTSAPLVAILLLCACVGPDDTQGATVLDLRIGMQVEAKGRVDERVVERVYELDKKPSDTPDKVEITAPVESFDRRRVTALGTSAEISDKTDWENADKQSIDAFAPGRGEWIKLKGRHKRAALHARTIRKSPERDRFVVEGPITRLDIAKRELAVGQVELRIDDAPRVQTLDQERRADNPLELFQEDDQKGVPFTVGLSDSLLLGGAAQLRFRDENEFDLDRNRSRDRETLRSEFKLDVLWLLAGGSFALLEGQLGRRDRFESSRPDSDTEYESISRAYAYLKLSDELRVIVGRQDFDEPREWLFDEVLDGLRLRATLEAWSLDLAFAGGRELLDEPNETEDTTTAYGAISYDVDEDHRLSAYALQRRDSTPTNFEPFLWGLRSFRRDWRGLNHWLELSHASGYVGRRRIEGFATDVGVTYRFDARLRPALTVGYALATGKRPGTDEVGYRQSGLQDNNAKFGGVTSFRYYGELFDPELNNLQVLTAAVGIRPLRNASIDVVAHSYRQHTLSNTSPMSELRPSPNGSSRDLGWEVDLILGWRYGQLIDFEITYGHFEPGDGFDSNVDADRLQVQVRAKF